MKCLDFFLKILFYLAYFYYVYGEGCACIRVHMPWNPKGGIRYPGAEVPGGGEPPDRGAFTTTGCKSVRSQMAFSTR